MAGRLRRLAADESGLTLVELLVTMITSIIVIIALFLFQDIVLRQATRSIAQVDATQRARIAIDNIENRLHSACVAENVTPILGLPNNTSTNNQLSFISKYGSGTTLIPEKHVITYTPINGGLDGTLVDKTYPLTGSTVPPWTFSGTASDSQILLDHVGQDGTTPVFRYYAYGLAKDSGGNNYQDAAGSPYMTLLDGSGTLPDGTRTSGGATVPSGTIPANSPTTLTATTASPLSSADAKIAAAVTVDLNVLPAGALGTNTQTDKGKVIGTPITSTIVLRLTPVPTEGNLPSVPPCA